MRAWRELLSQMSKKGKVMKVSSSVASIYTTKCLFSDNRISVKTGSSRSGTDERGKCKSIGLSAVCPSNEAMIRSVVVAVVRAKADQFWEWL